uniref:Uncharacterized protein n=1 Tax=Anguilla anguilla TaxID=7936 RepID=A0A0E9XIF6_ANGAN
MPRVPLKGKFLQGFYEYLVNAECMVFPVARQCNVNINTSFLLFYFTIFQFQHFVLTN